MRLHRFSVPFDFTQRVVRLYDKKICNQIKNVLRLGVHDQVVLSNMAGKEAHALITGLTATSASFEILEVVQNMNEPDGSVTLYCAILKKENFEWVAQKTTEIGIKELIPLITARTIKTNFSPQRLSAIMTEAAEQSGRGVVPTIGSICSFESALNRALSEGDVFVFDRQGDAIEKRLEYKRSCSIIIGPEGGWDEKEMELIRKSNAYVVSLGPLTFRAETAAIIASYCAVKYASKKQKNFF